eukprot:3914243-Pyramimonas_sp.AAC.1
MSELESSLSKESESEMSEAESLSTSNFGSSLGGGGRADPRRPHPPLESPHPRPPRLLESLFSHPRP